ncbi:MAG: VWA domain-containing protein [Gammaproteobacteria bacterium]|nr:VWA domain-containing protein [Gammaproteobacteria bacterium]
MWVRICDTRMLRHMTRGQAYKTGRNTHPWILAGVLTLGVIAAAAPSWSRLSYPIMESTGARIIVLDLSRSMLVQDIRPNRYQHAVAAASEIIGNGYQGETGLVVFASSAFVLAPLSRDDATLLAFLEAVHPDTMPQDGSNLAQAIVTAQDLLKASVSGQGQILLVSGGDSNAESAVQAALAAAAQGHRVSVLAIGTTAGGPSLDHKGGLLRDTNGELQIKKTNFELLRRIALAGNSSMVITDTAIGSDDLVGARLDANLLVESDRRADDATREAANDGAWLVWLMLPLTLLLFRRNQLWILLILVMAPAEREVYASEWEGFWTHPERIAFQAYNRADYDTTLHMTGNPLLRGASHYRDGDYNQALEQFDKGDSANSICNRANTLAQLERFSEAIVAYQQALELDPAMTAASYNKRLIELFLEQQSAAADDAADSDSGSVSADDSEAQQAYETRIGIASELQLNPADEQQLGPGFGASLEAGQVDPFERFDGLDPEAGRFVLRAQEATQAADKQFMERWISSLPETSSELYRRKFLRDFQPTAAGSLSMSRYRFICAAFGLLFSLAHAQTTSLRQNRIFEGDIAELTIEHDADIPSLYAIDSSDLDADFLVLDVRPRISQHVTENKAFHRMQWKIQMVPRHGGSIRIPSLAFGSHHSEALLLRVDQTPASIRAHENVLIEVEIYPEDPYPGQQTRVTTRLFHNLPLRDGRLAEPKSEQATVYRSGRDSRYSLLRAGESFDVLERSILLTPDSSGQLLVAGASFRGMITSATELAERYIYRQGENLQLVVREKPPGFDNRPWLPARQLELALQWDQPPDNLQAGDSLGFTLSMEATGLPAEALPADLLVTDSSQYKIYADEAARSTRVVNHFDGEQLVGRLQQRFVIFPQRSGEIVIPAITLAWWDVEQAVERAASIESRVVQVGASGTLLDNSSVINAVEPQVGASTHDLPLFANRHWSWLTTLVVVLFLAVAYAGSAKLRARTGAKIALGCSRRSYRQKLRRACHANDASATRHALIEWSRLHWNDIQISGLHHIESRVGSPELAGELARLDAAMFAERDVVWRGERLWELLGKDRSARSGQALGERDLLPGPYPHRA